MITIQQFNQLLHKKWFTRMRKYIKLYGKKVDWKDLLFLTGYTRKSWIYKKIDPSNTVLLSFKTGKYFLVVTRWDKTYFIKLTGKWKTPDFFIWELNSQVKREWLQKLLPKQFKYILKRGLLEYG